MKQYWQSLQPRERAVLIGGALALLILLAWVLVVEPFQQRIARVEQSVSGQQADLAWMRQAATEVRALRGNGPAAAASGGSLLAITDTTARAHGLAKAVKRVQPEGRQSVRVWLEKAAFDDVMLWLDTLSREHGVTVGSLVVDPAPETGLVDVRAVLEGTA